MNYDPATTNRWLRIGNWSFLVFSIIGLIGFAVLGKLWPPPGPDLSAAEISAFFRDNAASMKFGMYLMINCAPFYYIWSVVLYRIIRAIEGPNGVLAPTQLLCGTITGVIIFLPAWLWLVAAFRVESRPDETIQMLYDAGWLIFDMTYFNTSIQSLALGIAILQDRRAQTLFPRWLAWFAFLYAASNGPLVAVPYFTTGVFAWDGLYNFWVIFVLFFVWVWLFGFYGWRALSRIEAEEPHRA